MRVRVSSSIPGTRANGSKRHPGRRRQRRSGKLNRSIRTCCARALSRKRLKSHHNHEENMFLPSNAQPAFLPRCASKELFAISALFVTSQRDDVSQAGKRTQRMNFPPLLGGFIGRPDRKHNFIWELQYFIPKQGSLVFFCFFYPHV